MPTTRKKVVKTVYKDEDSEGETGDFSDSGSDAKISDASSSDEEQIEETPSSADEFDNKPRKKPQKPPVKRRPQFAKQLIGKINKQTPDSEETEALPLFSVRDLTDSDKLLPSVLNLSESDSSDDEAPRAKGTPASIPYPIQEQDESEEDKEDYADVWSSNIHDNSAEIAKKTFMELEKHKTTIEETKASIQNYVPRASVEVEKVSNVTDLLAMGEEAPKKIPAKKKARPRKGRDDSDSEVEDWEEVKDSKAIPQQGLQLVVELPNLVCRKSKKIDVEMMMKRKINRVKKEHQVFMHKVHVLCWLGHGNYVSPILNDQEIMAAVLAMVPKGCYPEGRLNMKYVEQITEWYKDKLTLKQDKNENKFKPKAPHLKNILLEQIKKRTVTAKKYSVFIFIAMLRALGLQCRVMFNFITVPLKPPSSELCSLSTKSKDDKNTEKLKAAKPKATTSKSKNISNVKLPQVDGIDDGFSSSDSEWENIMQVDGNDDIQPKRTMRSTRAKKVNAIDPKENQDHVSPPKRTKREAESSEDSKQTSVTKKAETKKVVKNPTNKDTNAYKSASGTNEVNLETIKSPKSLSLKKISDNDSKPESISNNKSPANAASPRKTRSNSKTTDAKEKKQEFNSKKTGTLLSQKVMSEVQSNDHDTPKIIVTGTNKKSKYFDSLESTQDTKVRSTRKRGITTIVTGTQRPNDKQNEANSNRRSRSAPGDPIEKSKYFTTSDTDIKKPKLSGQNLKKLEKLEDAQRVSHKEINKPKPKPKNDVTGDLVNLIKGRIKGAKEDAKKGIVKGKIKVESDEDSDYLPIEDPKRNSESDDDFKPTKISPRPAKLSPGSKPSTSKKQIDRRVISPDNELVNSNKADVWCEVFVEELEQWIPVDVIKGKVHGTSNFYSQATHPVCYVIGWDNNNYLKDLTRRYVPQWNTVTRKQRAEPSWWKIAVQPWLGPRNAKDREEDEALDRMQLEAPLPKSIAEYKNHPLYALKRHLLKYEAIYPADAATLGFVRSEAVYGRDCVYTCRSRDTWLKEAKVVKLGETPYKVVKARPKWDKLSNKLITDKPLEVFGPWQVKDYEPPTAQNGVVPRNAYGNVELFKDCMLPFGTVHIKLPGLNKVARKLNIDCAPAMTGFDFNGGWSHPVYDGFVVCKEFEEIITDAWVKDQEEQERKEREKVELRVYGNWKRLIKGLLIRERLKHKYGFEEPTTSQPKKKGPRFSVKKK